MPILDGSSYASFVIRLSQPSAEPVKVAWKTESIDAVPGRDYAESGSTVTFLPSETEKVVQVLVYGRAQGDDEERKFRILLLPAANVILGQSATDCIITVVDQDDQVVSAVTVANGRAGVSAYEVARLQGYEGNATQWLASLKGDSAAAQFAEEGYIDTPTVAAMYEELAKAGAAALWVTESQEITVGEDGDHGTLVAAIQAASRLKNQQFVNGGLSVTIRLLGGYVMDEQIIADRVDLSFITIVADDPIVPVAVMARSALSSADVTAPVFGGRNDAALPTIGALFAFPDDGNGYCANASDGVAVHRNSRVRFLPGSGIRRCRRGIQALYGSQAYCYMPGLSIGGAGIGAGDVTGVDFSYASNRALHLGYRSQAGLARSQFHHSKGDSAVYVIWNCEADIYQSQVQDSLYTAVHSRDGSTINARETQVARSRRGFHALHNARINARSKSNPRTLDFTRGMLPDGALLARATTGTYVNQLGETVMAEVDEPRFDHDPVTHAPIGLLIEAQEVVTIDLTPLYADDGTYTIRYVFDNDAAQDIVTTIVGGSTIVPTNLNRPRVKTILLMTAENQTLNPWVGDAARECRDYGVLASYNSQIDAADLDVSGGMRRGVHASDGSTINFTLGKANNCVERGISAFSGSAISAYGAEANDCGTGAIAYSGKLVLDFGSTNDCSRGVYGVSAEISFQGGRANVCTTGVWATRSTKINADTSSAQRCIDYGYYAAESSSIQARNSNASGVAGVLPSNGFYAFRKSSINCRGSIAQYCVVAVTALERADVNAQSVNALNSLTGFFIDRGSDMNVGAALGIRSQSIINLTSGAGVMWDNLNPERAASHAATGRAIGYGHLNPGRICQYRIANEKPLLFGDAGSGNDYDHLIATYGYTYVYPQASDIDLATNEWHVVAGVVGGDAAIRMWVSVFDIATGAYKGCYGLASTAGTEGCKIRRVGGSRFIEVRATATQISSFDITALPANRAVLTAASALSFDSNSLLAFSRHGDTMLVEDQTPRVGLYAARNAFNLWDVSSGTPVRGAALDFGILDSGLGFNAVSSPEVNYVIKRQGIALTDGHIIAAYGGFWGAENAIVTAAISGTTMTVTAITKGAIVVGDKVTGAGVAANTIVTALGTGTGGTGTYTVSVSQAAASTTITTSSNTNAYHYQGIILWDTAGKKIAEGLIDPAKMRARLIAAGHPCTRVENEGIFVTDDGRIWSLWVTLSRHDLVAPADARQAGVLLVELFSDHPDALDFAPDAAPARPWFDPVAYSRFWPRSGNTTSPALKHPLIGTVELTTDNDLLKVMEATCGAITGTTIYGSSVPFTLTDGTVLGGGDALEIINLNNQSYDVYLSNRNVKKSGRISGAFGARSLVWDVPELALGNTTVERAGSGSSTPTLTLRRSLGTQSSKAAVDAASLTCGQLSFQGYTSAGAWGINAAAVSAQSREALTSSAQGMDIVLGATPTGSIARAERLRVLGSGGVQLNGGPLILSGTGSPEGVVTATIGSSFYRTDGGVGTTHYRKTSGTGNTGWTAS